MLKIKDFIFQEDWGDRRSCLMFFKADQEERASWAVDIGFKPEESEEREDSFYIYENEPLIEYRIEVLDIVEAKAHIKCNGMLILDGYAEPWIEERFEIDSWVPVIESVQDWDKLSL